MYPGYVYREFPKWKYHAAGTEARIVDNASAEARLGPWWFDTPIEASQALTIALNEVLLPQAFVATALEQAAAPEPAIAELVDDLHAAARQEAPVVTTDPAPKRRQKKTKSSTTAPAESPAVTQ